MEPTTLDLYNRKIFAKQLLDDLECFSTPFSVGLDARWGNGKTFFVDNYLSEECTNRKIPLVKYDCFEHERELDPFISLTKVLFEETKRYMPYADAASSFSVKAEDAYNKAKSFTIGLFKVAGKAAVRHVFKQSVEEIEGVLKVQISDDSEKELADFVENQLKPAETLDKLKFSFYEGMTELINEVSPVSKSIVVVIDELDRCRPDHAVRVLEAIKHLLGIPGVIFIFTYHKTQLHSALRHIYGAGLDAHMYLQKFMDLDLELPGSEIPREDALFRNLFSETLAKTKLSQTQKDNILTRANLYCRLSKLYDFSPRDIKRCLMFEIAYERKNDKILSRIAVTVLIALKVKFGDVESLLGKASFPLPEDLRVKFKLKEVLSYMESPIDNTSTEFVRDLGFLFLEKDQLNKQGVGSPNGREFAYLLNCIHRVLGGISS